MMLRESLHVEVITTPGTDYQGKPYTVPSFRYWDREGRQHDGCVQFGEMIKGMGLDVRPGDLIKVTVEKS